MKQKLTLLLIALFTTVGAWADDVLPNAIVSAYFVQATPTMTVGASNHTINTDGSSITISPNNNGAFGATSGRFSCTLVVKINVPSTTTAGVLCEMRKGSANTEHSQGLYMAADRKLKTSWQGNGRQSDANAKQIDAGEHTIIYTTGDNGAVVYIDGTSNTLSDTGLKASGVSYKAIYIPAAYAQYITEVHFYSSIQNATNITSIVTECSNHIYASQHTEDVSVVVGENPLIIDTDVNLSKFSGANSASSIGIANEKTLTVNDATFNTTYTLSKFYGSGIVNVSEKQTANIYTGSDIVVFSGGAGTSESRVSINHNGGAVNLTGADKTYYLGGTNSNTQSTVCFDGTSVNYSNELAVGKATYNIKNTQITTPRLITSQGGNNRSAEVNLTGNSVITVTGNTNVDTNQSSIMIGHWNGTSNVTLSGTSQIAAVEAEMLIGKTGNTQTISLNDNSVITAKGIKLSANAGGPNTLNLNGGSLNLGDAGITSYSTSRSIAVNVNENSTITSTAETMPISQPITVAAGKTLDIDGNTHNVVLTGTITNNGTINFKNATLTVNLNDRSLANYTFTSCTATVQFVETTDEYKAGGFTIEDIPSGVTIKVKKYGTTEYETVSTVDGTATITHEVGVSGLAAWLDYTFNESTKATNIHSPADQVITNAGNAGSGNNLNIDGSYTTATSYNEDGTLKVMSTPWRNITWPTNYTVAVAGNVPDVENGCLVAFGSSTNGSQNYLAIIRGASQNEIKLVKGHGQNSAFEVISTMTAANATALSHLVVFTKNGNTFTVYLDGVQKTQVTYSETLGGGFQIGSIHGGITGTGVGRVNDMSDATAKAKVFAKAIRVYDYVISSDQMEALTEEFPYTSFGGKYSRTITENSNLSATDAWLNTSTQGNVDVPVNATVDAVTYYPDVEITTTAASTLTVNADMDAENIKFDGAGKLTIASDGTHNIHIYGSLTANGPISVKYGETDLSAVPVSIGESGSIEFDFSDYDFSGVTTSTDYPVTGNTSDYDSKVTGVYPSDIYHDYTLAYNGSTNSYSLTVEPSALYLNQLQAIALVKPYYDGNLVGASLGRYTIKLGETSYANFADFGTEVMSWETIGDCVEPTITLNTPSAGFYRVKNVATDKYLYATAASGYTSTDRYVYANGNNSGAETIIQLAEHNGHLYMLTQGHEFGWIAESSTGSGQVGYVRANGFDKYVNWLPGTAAGQIAFAICYGNGTGDHASYLTQGIYAVDNQDNAVIRGTDYTENAAQWIFEPATDMSITLNGPVESYYYATFCVPFDVNFGTSAAAFTLSKEGTTLTTTEVTGNTVPAGTPVLLVGEHNSATATIGSNYINSPVSGTALTGNFFAIPFDGTTNYTLGSDGAKVGFYHWDGTTLSANRAYVAGSSGNVKGYVLNFDDDATGIEMVNGQSSMVNDPIYNLAGQRISKMQKGINIVNGKKIMVK